MKILINGEPIKCPPKFDAEACSQYMDMLTYQAIEKAKFDESFYSDPMISTVVDAFNVVNSVCHFVGDAAKFVMNTISI